MKAIAVLFLLGVIGEANACVFGDHLVAMARMRDLHADAEVKLTPASRLSSIQMSQIVAGMRAGDNTEVSSPKTAFAITDDNTIRVRRVWDSAHKRAYSLYVYEAGENVSGFIFKEKGSLVAKIGDGSIYECKPEFENYDSLPWFYTN